LDRSTSPRLHAVGRRDDAMQRQPAPTAIAGVAACATVALVPFAALHFARGEAAAGWLHVAVIAALAASTAWSRRGDARMAGWIGAAAVTLGCGALVALRGGEAVHWAYAAVSANFLLLRPREAAAVSAALVAAIVLAGGAHDDLAARIGFLVTATLLALGLHAFAARVQRHVAEADALAMRDPLTGAGNARAFESELRLAAEAARRDMRACGVAVLDVDHHAQLLDRHGAEVAEQVLVDLARVVGDATRRTDRLFRTGSDTFVLLLPGADTAVLGPMLDSLRLRIGDVLQVDGEIVGVSIGAAALRAGEEADAWLARAQAALSHARDAGRNRVEVSDCTVTTEGTPIRTRRAGR
jgi:diguanylate cyclase (GGDEF)-like protein